MNYTIEAKPTIYNGTRYRSRLEARWAAFFDLIGWKYQYEPYDLKGWTPDFVIYANGKEILCEVKPTLDHAAKEKYYPYAIKHPVLLLVSPLHPDVAIMPDMSGMYYLYWDGKLHDWFSLRWEPYGFLDLFCGHRPTVLKAEKQLGKPAYYSGHSRPSPVWDFGSRIHTPKFNIPNLWIQAGEKTTFHYT